MELPVIDLLIVRVRWVYLHRSSPSLPVSLSAVSPLPSLLTCTCHAARCFGMCYPDTAPRHPPAGCTPGLKDPLNESRRILNKYGRPALLLCRSFCTTAAQRRDGPRMRGRHERWLGTRLQSSASTFPPFEFCVLTYTYSQLDILWPRRHARRRFSGPGTPKPL